MLYIHLTDKLKEGWGHISKKIGLHAANCRVLGVKILARTISVYYFLNN